MRTLEKVVENLSWLINEDCSDTQWDYIEDIEVAIKMLNRIKDVPFVHLESIYKANIPLERLEELCTAEREDRLRILARHSIPHNTVAYSYDRYGVLRQGKVTHCNDVYRMRFDCDTMGFPIDNYDIGKTVFLTKTEAEKALAERKKNGTN